MIVLNIFMSLMRLLKKIFLTLFPLLVNTLITYEISCRKKGLRATYKESKSLHLPRQVNDFLDFAKFVPPDLGYHGNHTSSTLQE